MVGGDLTLQPTDRTRLTLVTERSVQESVSSTNVAYLANLVTLAAEHFLTPKLLLPAACSAATATTSRRRRR